MLMYNEKKDEHERKGYTPFVCFVKWTPEEEPIFLARFCQLYATPEGEGVVGLHAWNLIGRNTMIVIGWMNSAVSLQKFCTSWTHGTGITVEPCPAIDHFALDEALRKLKSRIPKIPVPKGSPCMGGAHKAEGRRAR